MIEAQRSVCIFMLKISSDKYVMDVLGVYIFMGKKALYEAAFNTFYISVGSFFIAVRSEDMCLNR